MFQNLSMKMCFGSPHEDTSNILTTYLGKLSQSNYEDMKTVTRIVRQLKKYNCLVISIMENVLDFITQTFIA